jgi:hypothetical protein
VTRLTTTLDSINQALPSRDQNLTTFHHLWCIRYDCAVLGEWQSERHPFNALLDDNL